MGSPAVPNCSAAQSRAGLGWRHLSVLLNASLLSAWIYNEHVHCCRDGADLISCADTPVCRQSAEWSLPLHKHGAAHCGSMHHTRTHAHTHCDGSKLALGYIERERQVEKVTCQCSWHFCSAGSSVACLPGGPLRQERVHWDPAGPPPSQTPDRGARHQTLQRPYYTSHSRALQWPLDDKLPNTFFFIRK